MKDEPLFSIGELAAAASVTRRTVRFYVQRGLLPAPLGLGRGQHYGRAHLRQLLEIKRMQLQGVSLDEIRARLTGGADEWREPRTAAPSARPVLSLRPPGGAVPYHRQVILPGYELHVTAPGHPLSTAELAELRALLQRLSNDSREEP